MPAKTFICEICGAEVSKPKSYAYKTGRACRIHQDEIQKDKTEREVEQTCQKLRFFADVYAQVEKETAREGNSFGVSSGWRLDNGHKLHILKGIFYNKYVQKLNGLTLENLTIEYLRFETEQTSNAQYKSWCEKFRGPLKIVDIMTISALVSYAWMEVSHCKDAEMVFNAWLLTQCKNDVLRKVLTDEADIRQSSIDEVAKHGPTTEDDIKNGICMMFEFNKIMNG